MLTTKGNPISRLSKSAVLFLLFSFVVVREAVICPCIAGSAPRRDTPGPPPTLVEVSEVVEKDLFPGVTLVGTAEPWMEIVVASEEAGLIRRMLVDEGDKVGEMQTLCVQDTSQLGLMIEAAQAGLAEAEVLRAMTDRELTRQKRLFAIKSVSEKIYEDTRFEAQASSNKVERLRAELAVLEDRLEKKKIYAPVSGHVVKRHTLVGQWVSEGGPVVTLVVLDPIRVIVPVPERHVAWIRKGDTSEIAFDALPHRTFEGVIGAVIPRADRAARTFPVRIEVPNPGGEIKAGMLGRATLLGGVPYKATLVPKDALVLSGTSTYVCLVNDQSVRFVPVNLGHAHGAFIEVTGNLKAGSKVVVRGNERLRPGQSVEITKTVIVD